MPKIPVLDQPRINEGQTPNTQVNVGTSVEAATAGVRQVQQISQQMATLGGIGLGIARDMAQTRALSEYSQFKKDIVDLEYNSSVLGDGTKVDGFRNIQGEAALKRPTNTTLSDEYISVFDQRAADYEKNLSDQMQRDMFRNYVGKLRTGFYESAKRHELDQLTKWQASTYEAGIDTSVNSMSIKYRDLNALDSDWQDIEEMAVPFQRMVGGKSDVFGKNFGQERASLGIKAAVYQAVNNNDIDQAEQIINKFSNRLSEPVKAEILNYFKPIKDKKVAIDTVSKVFDANNTGFNPDDFETSLFPLIEKKESNRQQFDKDGNPLRSQIERNGVIIEGAVGKYQVMPDSGKFIAEKIGLEWNPELFYRKKTGDAVLDAQAEKYNEKLGKGLFRYYFAKFDGDVEKALAAYNAGDGTVQKAINYASKHPEEGDWKQAMRNFQSPKNFEQTQDYLNTIVPSFKSTAVRREIDLIPDKETLRQQSLASLGADPSPAQIASMDTELDRRYKDMVDSIKQRKEILFAKSYQSVVDNSGNLDQIPMNELRKLDPDQLSDLQNKAQMIRDGVRTSNKILFHELMNNDAKLSQMSQESIDGMIRAQFNMEDYGKVKERWAVLTGRTSKSSETRAQKKFLQYDSVSKLLNESIEGMGQTKIDPKKSDHVLFRNAMIELIQRDADSFEATNGKMPDYEELRNIINKRVYSKIVKDGWFFDSNIPLTDAIDGLSVPNKDAEKIKKEYEKKFGVEPSESQILSRYFEQQQKSFEDWNKAYNEKATGKKQ